MKTPQLMKLRFPLAVGCLLVMLGVPSQVLAGTWSFTLQGAAKIPQDVWIAGSGNNTDGWQSGGSICLGHLAQGFELGQHAMLLTDVVEAGMFGADGRPVSPGMYTFPSQRFGSLDYEVAEGKTFYGIVDAYIVNSNIEAFPVGETIRLMFTFDAIFGRVEQKVALWFGADDGTFTPFLNEGLMMTNVRALRH